MKPDAFQVVMGRTSSSACHRPPHQEEIGVVRRVAAAPSSDGDDLPLGIIRGGFGAPRRRQHRGFHLRVLTTILTPFESKILTPL